MPKQIYTKATAYRMQSKRVSALFLNIVQYALPALSFTPFMRPACFLVSTCWAVSPSFGVGEYLAISVAAAEIDFFDFMKSSPFGNLIIDCSPKSVEKAVSIDTVFYF
jgi:hypothetical protein